MASSTNNPSVFPMTLFYDDTAPLDQDTKPTYQTPNSSEFPSQEQMQPNENAPQQKGDILYNKSYKAGVANIFGGCNDLCDTRAYGIFVTWSKKLKLA